MQMFMCIGNLTKEPEEIKGQPLCKITVAVNENFTDKDGNRPVNYFNIALWNKLSEIGLKYLHKGSKVAVLGNIQNRVWEDANGQKKYAIEVIAKEVEFLNAKKEG